MRARATLALLLADACGPDEHAGITRHVNLPGEPSGGEAGVGGTAGGGDGGQGTVEPPGPPEVTAMMPLSGPYGTQVRVIGSNLGSAARSGVKLTLGSATKRDLDPESKPEIVSWTETEIRFRFPFPLAGEVVVETPEGTAVAGEFEPSWVPGESRPAPSGVKSIASIAHAPGVISAVLDTGPPELVTFDGVSPSASEVDNDEIRPETIRLYREGSELRAFALAAALDHEIIELDPNDAFSATPSGVAASADHALAGGREGASVWFRVANNWTRARPSAGVWAVDFPSIADPQPSGDRHTAAAGSDGSLYVGWAEETNDLLDDLGAPFFRRLVGDGSAFLGKTRAGIDLDDYISSFTMESRGFGIVARYCGTDLDPLGATDDELLCYAALLPSGIRSTVKESSSVRYAFDGIQPLAAYCSASLGVRIVSEVVAGTSVGALEARAGEIVAWPCAPIVALEMDDEGQPLVILQFQGELYSPRPRVP